MWPRADPYGMHAYPSMRGDQVGGGSYGCMSWRKSGVARGRKDFNSEGDWNEDGQHLWV